MEGVPVYDTIDEAQGKHSVDASLVMVPPPAVLGAVAEAVEAEIPLVVVVTEGVPVLDAVRMISFARSRGVRLVGPNSTGMITPGETRLGIMPATVYSPGPVGIVSRSGTLMHEVASNLTHRGVGQSTCVGIGGDPVIGTRFGHGLELLREDPRTDVAIIIGEIGGSAEQEAAEYLGENGYPKPVLAYIAGQTAPPRRRMGHAGAIVEGDAGEAVTKIRSLREAGVEVVSVIDDLLTRVRVVM